MAAQISLKRNRRMTKRYSEVIKLPTFEERFKYLRLNGKVSELTFGHNRYLNQDFYHSAEWLRFRREVIIRDDGCDLADPDRKIYSKILIHHLNPITVDDIVNARSCVFDPENAICTTHKTHNLIHYGDLALTNNFPIERTQNDTIPWR